MWDLLDAMGITERSVGDGEDDQETEAEALLAHSDGRDGHLQNTIVKIQWLYLPQPVLHHIFEFAMYLW